MDIFQKLMLAIILATITIICYMAVEYAWRDFRQTKNGDKIRIRNFSFIERVLPEFKINEYLCIRIGKFWYKLSLTEKAESEEKPEDWD